MHWHYHLILSSFCRLDSSFEEFDLDHCKQDDDFRLDVVVFVVVVEGKGKRKGKRAFFKK